MALYHEISAPYANFMQNPAKPGPRVCATCRTFANPGYNECYPCGGRISAFAAVVPLSYSFDGEQMHHNLRNYKDGPLENTRRQLSRQLAAVLWSFLEKHEACIAKSAGVEAFPLVTTVPSGSTIRDNSRGNLRRIVGDLCKVTADRYARVLVPTDQAVGGRTVDPGRYVASPNVAGRNVLVIDDTWTTGASAESAGAALQAAGAGSVALVVFGRHIHRSYNDNAGLLAALPTGFDWDDCAVH